MTKYTELRYSEFHKILHDQLGVPEKAVRDGLSLLKRRKFRVTRYFYDRGGRVVGVHLFVQSRSREGVEHSVTIGIGTAKCTCEDSTINGNVCAHMVVGLKIMWDKFKERGERFPLEDVVEKFYRSHGKQIAEEKVVIRV